ncbi:SubName: Full=Uncharacterized protein {ECO:0000313/EMBL:CCA74111.1} [Serendipita indica DSM 11827]|nr:SubName: Full=Uncharacterized protein {ECO:0000313/EMBL:CCA74111.1} [Serendipita indica DSM 11827]
MSLMDFPHHAHPHHGHGHHAPRRHNTTALDTQNIDIHPSHMRVNSLSSKGSLSDYPILRTPQDPVQPDSEAMIKHQDESSGANAWKPSMGIVQEQLTSSPVDEVFSGRSTPGKPTQMHINTSFTQRSRPGAYSAHPNQKSMGANTTPLPAPQSATAAFPPMQLPSITGSSATLNGTSSTTNQSRQPPSVSHAEVKLPDTPPQRPGQSQSHRRTQSAPMLSLSPLTANAPQEAPIPPPATNYASGAGSLGRSSYPPADLNPLQPTSYPQINPMTQAAPFTPFPAMNGFQTTLPGVAQTVSPLMWPGFFAPPTAPGNFYSPRPPQLASPAPSMYNQPTQPPQPAPTTQWKINPNSQPQMPLSHLINQAQGMILGGPSAHNRKIGLYKTEICRNWEEKQSCRYGVKCQFAHGPSDIRTVPRHPKYKTEICRTFWVTGNCPYGKRCCFIHPTSTSTSQGPGSVANAPLSGPAGTSNGVSGPAPSKDDTDRETQHAISLLARLDLKRGSPEGLNSRRTPDSNASDANGFVYPGLNGHSNGIDGERSGSGARV